MAPARRRILLLVPSFAGGAGGAERVFSILARHLDRQQFEVHLALAQGQHSQLRQIPDDVTIHDMRLARMRYALPAIVRLARQIRPQVILSTVVYLNAMLMMARPFLPRRTRVLLREAIMPNAFITQEARHPRFWGWVYRNLYGKADKIICLSDSMALEFEHFGVPRGKLERIYNPIEAQAIRQAAEGAADPYSGPGPHLVTVGRLQKQKALDILLKAMPLVRREFTTATLTIVGEGPLERELKDQARNSGLSDVVSFVGFQPNPWAFMKHADAFVLASRFEGMPNTLLEALALGTPCVVTDCPGGVREIKTQFPEIALVPTEDPSALAAAIITASHAGSEQRSEDVSRDFGSFGLDEVLRRYTDVLLEGN
jgi:glycosyltransferase involved in cell wall biosynthesis